MAMIDNSNTYSRRRLALLTVLTWWSSQHHQETVLVEASLLRQHRVKISQRQVPYQHVLEGQPRNGRYARVQHSGYSYNSRKDKKRHPLNKESHDEDDLWVLHVSAAGDNSYMDTSRNKRRKLGGDSSSSSKLLEFGYWRQLLFDQFVGQEIPPGWDNINGTNVTTEVEFESIVDGSLGGNSSQTSQDEGGDSSSTASSAATSNITIITGNATEAGNITESVVYTKPADVLGNSTSTSNATFDDADLTIPKFQPLRIRAILAEESGQGSLLNETERNALFHDMLSPALLAWSSSLRVDPVVGNLTVDVKQLLDGETCGPGIDSGLPSVQVPLHHLQEGVPDTDMIVYLSLGFTVNSYNESNSEDEEAFDTTFAGNSSDGIVASTESEEGVKNEDLVVYDVEDHSRDGMGGRMRHGDRRHRRLFIGDIDQAKSPSIGKTAGERAGSLGDGLLSSINDPNGTTTINICTGDYLAAASYCSSDQYDRPTAALLHICIDDTFFNPNHLQRNILTIMHELGHALGFNSLSMAHFRKPDGTPYTRRDKSGNVPEETIECTGVETEHQYATVALPSKDILKFREVRGGVRVAEIVTPSVLQVVRNQFDCQHLTGAELESGEGLPLGVTGEEGCIGDHWKRRLFSSDLMNPVVDDLEYSTRISTLTLAYFADSGWYQVDLSNANVVSGWGRGVGCSFVNDPCLTAAGDVPPQNAPFFCNDINSLSLTLSSRDISGCTPDLTRKATCSIGQYDLDLPPAYQYFNSTYGADVGGSDSLMDFCPVYAGYDNGLCSSRESEIAIKAFDVERFGQRNSRCLVGNVRPFYQPTALCLPIACVIQDHSLRIKVDDIWHICEGNNQKIFSTSVTIDCPDPRRVCPTFFCPYDCLGTDGQCDYDNGRCLCEYLNSTGNGETSFEDCRKVQELEVMAASTLRPIIRPDEPRTNDPAVPPADHTISDYYVPDARSLEDKPLVDAFVIALLSLTGVIVVAFVMMLLYARVSSKKKVAPQWDCFGFLRRQGDENPLSGEGGPSPNPDKDKMVATVLVDMRINNNARWRLRRGQDSSGSVGDTEGRLTESEATSGPASISDMSSRHSENLSDIDTSQDDINLDDMRPEVVEELQVIRRRRACPDSHA